MLYLHRFSSPHNWLISHLETIQPIPSRAENWGPQSLVLPPRSVYLTSSGKSSLMSHSTKLPFSVAKFTIEGVGEGADHLCSAPPRLSSSRMTPATNSTLPFPINPFSLSQSLSIKSHACLSSSQGSVNSFSSAPASAASSSCTSRSLSQSPTIINHSSPPALVSSISSPLQAQPPFPNPFLITRNPHLHSAPVTAHEKPTDPSASSTQTPVHNAQSISHSSISHIMTPSSSSIRKPRKPWADRVLAPSSFRPRVMAADRLFSWHTPYGLSHDESVLAELPPALAESAKMSIMGALATSSKSTYAAGILRFSQFCDRWQISEVARMPASYALLCAFIGNHKGSVSGKTIKSWLSGIRAWHLTNHAPWYGDDGWVKMARISANKEGSRHKRPLRSPVSIEHLLALRRAINKSNHFHAAVWVVALVTFFGCRRLGEIILTSVSSFDSNFHALRSTMYVYDLYYAT